MDGVMVLTANDANDTLVSNAGHDLSRGLRKIFKNHVTNFSLQKALSHSLVKVWIHVVFRTKYSAPIILPSFETELFDHICKHAEKKFHCRIEAINGTSDHMHILFRLDPRIAIMDLMKNIKGESSHWVNEQRFIGSLFKWQIGYGAFSVSEAGVRMVQRYIQNQKIHHRLNTVIKEFEQED